MNKQSYFSLTLLVITGIMVGFIALLFILVERSVCACVVSTANLTAAQSRVLSQIPDSPLTPFALYVVLITSGVGAIIIGILFAIGNHRRGKLIRAVKDAPSDESHNSN